jgi:hypothetical protein
MNNSLGIEFDPHQLDLPRRIIFLYLDYEVIDYEILNQFIEFMIYFNMKIEIAYLYLFINYPSG